MAKFVHKIEKIARHRNGVAGAPFWVVSFQGESDVKPGNAEPMVAVVFAKESDDGIMTTEFNPKVAVMNRNLIAENIIEFGQNSYRGDRFDRELIAAINEKNQEV
jgi:hypothetical protein